MNNPIARRLGDQALQASARGEQINLFRWAKSVGRTSNLREAAEDFAKRYPNSNAIEKVKNMGMVQKSPVAAGSTTDSTWAAPLVAQPLSLIIDANRNAGIFARLKQFMTPMPQNIKAARVLTSSTAYWNSQGFPVPVSALTMDTLEFNDHLSVNCLIAISQELGDQSDAEPMLSRDQINSMAATIDDSFLQPLNAGVAEISPASVVYGTTEITSTGTTLDAFISDLRRLLAEITTSGSGLVLIMRRSTALWLLELSNADGSLAFPNLGALGGSIWGIPCLVTNNAPADPNSPSNGTIYAVDASELLYHEGPVVFTRSENVLLEMSSTPDSPRTAATTLVSCYQSGLIAILARQYINFVRRRSGSVAWLSGLVA